MFVRLQGSRHHSTPVWWGKRQQSSSLRRSSFRVQQRKAGGVFVKYVLDKKLEWKQGFKLHILHYYVPIQTSPRLYICWGEIFEN